MRVEIPPDRPSRGGRGGLARVVIGLAALLLGAWPRPSGAGATLPNQVEHGSSDPVVPMLRRVDRYLQGHEVAGVVLDWRVVLNRTEAARLSVVPQLLGYCEIHKVAPSARLRGDIVRRADDLVDHLGEYRSGSVFDGMLAQALLEAFEATGDSVYFAAGEDVIRELKAIPHSEYILNGGLMAAMGFAKDWQLTGNAESAALAREALGSLPAYQHEDGSFPHWCPCSTDIHYTDWMTTELILIERMLDDERIEPMLRDMLRFLEGRIDANGVTVYQELCPDDNDGSCWIYYDSVRSGCGIDYDTRAFTNEIGYSALVFDHFHSPKFPLVMRFLKSLESGGTWADKWDFWPPPSDPYYPWTAADTSVVNTSLLFWSLATVMSGRDHAAMRAAWEAQELEDPLGEPAAGDGRSGDSESIVAVPRHPSGARPVPRASAPPWLRWAPAPASALANCVDRDAHGGPRAGLRSGPRLMASPNPARDGVALSYSLPRAAHATLAVYDAAGRSVRRLADGDFPAGPGTVRWNGADASGRRCASGVYFAHLATGAGTRVIRLLWLGEAKAGR